MSNPMSHERRNRLPGGMSEYMPDNMSAGGDHSKKVIFIDLLLSSLLFSSLTFSFDFLV